MSFNEEAFDLFAYQQSRLEDVGAGRDMDALPALLDCTLHEGSASRLVGHQIHVRRKQCQAGRHSDIAHEVSHKLAQERGDPEDPNFEEIIRHRHAHVHNQDAHLEALITAGQDRIRMSDHVVQTILNICGLNAMAVWVLHQQETVYLHEALRRIVEHDENARMGGFIARRGKIVHACSYRYRLPVWVGHSMPDGVNDDFGGENTSLFEVPGLVDTFIGLVVIEEG